MVQIYGILEILGLDCMLSPSVSGILIMYNTWSMVSSCKQTALRKFLSSLSINRQTQAIQIILVKVCKSNPKSEGIRKATLGHLEGRIDKHQGLKENQGWKGKEPCSEVSIHKS